MKKIIYWLSKLTCVVAMGMAVASVIAPASSPHISRTFPKI